MGMAVRRGRVGRMTRARRSDGCAGGGTLYNRRKEKKKKGGGGITKVGLDQSRPDWRRALATVTVSELVI